MFLIAHLSAASAPPREKKSLTGHRIDERADPLDLDFHRLARPKVDRGISLEADAGWSAGEDDRAGKQGKAVGEVGYDVPDREDHVRGVGGLHYLPVQAAENGKIVGIQIGFDGRSDRAEGVVTL